MTILERNGAMTTPSCGCGASDLAAVLYQAFWQAARWASISVIRPGCACHLRRPSKARVGIPQVPLLLRRRPGSRRSFGRCVLFHSRLLEGASCLNETTRRHADALPDYETQAGDVFALHSDKRHFDYRRPDVFEPDLLLCGSVRGKCGISVSARWRTHRLRR